MNKKSESFDRKKEKRQIILTDKELRHMTSLQSIYMNRSDKKQRHEKVLRRLEELQIGKARERSKEMEEKVQARRESIERQRKQLGKMRTKYSDEQEKRVQKQFMSWSGVDTVVIEQSFRSDYGLPEEHEHKVYANRLARRKKEDPAKMLKEEHLEDLRTRNKEKLNMVLNPSYGAHVAERVMLADVTLDDIRKATKKYKKMSTNANAELNRSDSSCGYEETDAEYHGNHEDDDNDDDEADDVGDNKY